MGESMPITLRVAALVLTLAACTGPGRPLPASAPMPQAPAAIVGPAAARFVVPVERATAWRWSTPATAANALEYQWEVVLANGAGAEQPYQFGFSLFKHPEDTPGAGPLSALLSAGQATVWEPTSGGSMEAAAWGRVAVAAVGDSAVAITVTDPETLTRLFATRPVVAVVVTQSPGQVERRSKIAIAYTER